MKKVSVIVFVSIAALGAAVLGACNPIESGEISAYEKEIKAAVEGYVPDVVYATYGSLAQAGKDLYEDLDAMKSKGVNALSQADIDKACADFLAARALWEASEAFLFGAATDFSIDPHIDSWPLDASRLAINLSNKAAVEKLAEEGMDAIDLIGESALGFHGIEFILFRDGKNRTLASLKAEETATEFKGSGVTGEEEIIFAAAVAEDLMTALYQLNVSWNPAAPQEQKDAVEAAERNCTVNGTDRTYGENMLGATAAGSTYATWQQVAQTIIDAGCANIANEVFSSKMGMAFSGEDPSYIESPYSKKSFVDFKDNILSIQYSLYGAKGASEAKNNSLMSFLKKNHKEDAAVLESKLAAALNALDACIGSGKAFVDDPKAKCVETAIDAISELNDALGKAASDIKD